MKMNGQNNGPFKVSTCIKYQFNIMQRILNLQGVRTGKKTILSLNCFDSCQQLVDV